MQTCKELWAYSGRGKESSKEGSSKISGGKCPHPDFQKNSLKKERKKWGKREKDEEKLRKEGGKKRNVKNVLQ